MKEKQLSRFLLFLGILTLLVGLILTGYINISIVLIDEIPPTIEKVVIKNYNKTTKKLSIEVHVKDNVDKEVTCYLNNEKQLSKQRICNYELPNDNYEIYLEDNHNNKNEKQSLFKDINEILDIIIENPKYITLNENTKLNYKLEYIGNPNKALTFTSSNKNIIEVTNDGQLKPKKTGKSTITITTNNNIEKSFDIVVTNLINSPKIVSKQFLPCNKYTQEEAKTFDEILNYRVEQAGNKTRAGVVAAARFLLLEFPYKLNYFPENGRLASKTHIVDGEGRYYHKGLYLSNDKFNEITKTSTGPAIWGCNLKIALGEPDQKKGEYYPNGLDCSGFVAWALLNGGYDPGDLGAGFSNVNDFSKLGKRNTITYEYLKNGKIKAGDLIGNDGHIGIILGVSDNLIIIGDTSNKDRGLTARKFTHKQLINLGYYDYIETMDDYYKEDGNYTNMF